MVVVVWGIGLKKAKISALLVYYIRSAFNLGSHSIRLDFNSYMATRPSIYIQTVTVGSSGGQGRGTLRCG